MKILEAQSATLTNFEVYNHLMEQGLRYKQIDQDAVRAAEKRKEGEDIKARQKGEIPSKERPVIAQNLLKRPGNLWTLRKELLDYFREAPSPLGCKPMPYDADTIRNLLIDLRPWQITKGEVIMMLNLRPTKLENLNTIIQEMQDRFPDEEQEKILAVITRVLGQPDEEKERKKMADDTKLEQAREREEQTELEQKEQVMVDVDEQL